MKQDVMHVTLATELHAIEEQRKALAKREEEIRWRLVKSLKEQGVRSIKLDDGTVYTRALRQTLTIAKQDKAEAWADTHNCWKVDLPKAKKILQREMKLPTFFKLKDVEYLVVKRVGDKEENHGDE